jgi:hypothetical protein
MEESFVGEFAFVDAAEGPLESTAGLLQLFAFEVRAFEDLLVDAVEREGFEGGSIFELGHDALQVGLIDFALFISRDEAIDLRDDFGLFLVGQFGVVDGGDDGFAPDADDPLVEVRGDIANAGDANDAAEEEEAEENEEQGPEPAQAAFSRLWRNIGVGIELLFLGKSGGHANDSSGVGPEGRMPWHGRRHLGVAQGAFFNRSSKGRSFGFVDSLAGRGQVTDLPGIPIVPNARPMLD